MFERRSLPTLALLAVALAALTAACSDTEPTVAAAPQPDLVWPAAPEIARIKFLQTLSRPKDIGITPGFFESIVNFVKGMPERRMSAPYGIHKTAAGRLYVVDTFHKAVEVFDTRDKKHYWFPKRPFEGFENPVGVAADEGGRVYVSDSQAKVIHVFEDHGRRYLKALGEDVLQRPTGLAFNPATGELLVTDTLVGQIVVFDTDSLTVSRLVGRKGEADKTFNFPTSVAVSAAGKVFVTDSMNFRIQMLAPDFGYLGSFGAVGDTPGRFSRPKGVAVDSDGHVYVVDALFDNVQIFDAQGRLLLAFGSPGAAPGQFWLPNEIFIDGQDRIYVSDAYNKRIQVFQYLKQGGGQ